MYRNSQSADSELNKAMTNEQFNQVVDAILSGKYSWACLLILRFSGYNPLHYIPYRTYNRLMKTNREQNPVQPVKSPQKSPGKLQDLYYIEDLEHQSSKVKGGQRVLPINSESHWLVS